MVFLCVFYSYMYRSNSSRALGGARSGKRVDHGGVICSLNHVNQID